MHRRPLSVLMFLATEVLLCAALNGGDAAEQPFRDPLTGKSSSVRSAARPLRQALLQVALTADPQGGSNSAVATLSIRLNLPDGGYTYSTNPDFSGATRIKLIQNVGVEPAQEPFVADHEPKIEFQADFQQEVEKFTEAVTWTRKFRLRPGAKLADVRILGQVKYQICDSSSCTPHDETFLVGVSSSEVIVTEPTKLAEFKSRLSEFAASAEPASAPAPAPPTEATVASSAVKPFELEVSPQRGKLTDPIKLRFRLFPENAKPGESVLLSVTMELEPGWHTFALDQNPENVGLPTMLELTQHNGLKPAEEKFAPSLAPEIARTSDGKEQRIHHKQITWTMPLVVDSATYGVGGVLKYQICREGQCRPLKSVPFELGHLPVVVEPSPPPPTEPPARSHPTQVEIPPLATDDDSAPLFKGEKFVPREDEQAASLGLFLIYAFLGGLILNVMPCVLPVIAIKVLSFVQQSGESRGRVLLLNLAYAVGVIVVFLLLASLAVFANLGWGNLFQRTEFQIAMSCVVFAMGLSLLGVFEIPVPGMIGSAASHQQQEGPLGAFLTGIFATLLATPCSGPFLGVTLGWSVQQPAHITYLVWFVMGLGMASPYILLGFFPGWVKYLPKPGNWMVTFKEVCGFVLMGTVIFLMSSLKAVWVLPLLIMLLSIGFSLWMIGHLYSINSTSQRRWTVRTLATVVSVVGCWLAIGLADERPRAHELPWRPFAGKTVKQELARGRTVLVDFTADWCLSCKTNEKLALNTPETLARVKQHNIVTLKADWTDGSPEITQWLEAFDSVSVPLTVIFPGGDPLHPIVIRDLYAKSELLKKLDAAIEAKSERGRELTQR